MSGGILGTPIGIQDGTGVPAAAMVGANARVQVTTGLVGLVTDMLSFPGPSTIGNWFSGNQRVLVNNVPTVGLSATGQAIVPGTPPVPGPARVAVPDSRVTAD